MLRAFALAFLICACNAPLPAHPPGTPENRAELAIVMLIGDPDGFGPSCAAVAVGPNELATAGHCVAREHVAFATRQDWESNSGMGVARVMRVDEGNDLALLRSGERFPVTVEISRGALVPGESVYTVRHVAGSPWSYVSGYVVSGDRTDGEGAHFVQVDMPMPPGSSGAGLFDSNGRLVGVGSGRDADSGYFGAGWKVAELVGVERCQGGKRTCF